MLREEKEYIFSKMHVSMSSLLKGDVVPLHDHGNQEGFLFIASGKVRIKTFAIQKTDVIVLHPVSDKIYEAGEHALVTVKNNVHSIEAVETSEIVDVFSVTPDQNIQNFLKIVSESGVKNSLVARFATLDEVNIAPHILEKDREMPKIRVDGDCQA